MWTLLFSELTDFSREFLMSQTSSLSLGKVTGWKLYPGLALGKCVFQDTQNSSRGFLTPWTPLVSWVPLRGLLLGSCQVCHPWEVAIFVLKSSLLCSLGLLKFFYYKKSNMSCENKVFSCLSFNGFVDFNNTLVFNSIKTKCFLWAHTVSQTLFRLRDAKIMRCSCFPEDV